MIGEQVIEQVLLRHEEEGADYEALVETFQGEQPEVMGWLFSESSEALTQREREYLLYLVIIIWQVATQASGQEPIPRPAPEAISEAEENNWDLLSEVKSRRFHERLDVFFRDSPEEDLLAFAEDALSDHEDGHVSKEGREAMFIMLKTLVDLWVGKQD